MDVRHWTEDDFLNRLYGLGHAPEEHLEACEACRILQAKWQSRHSAATAEPEVSHEFLAAQRRAIYRRLGEKPSHPGWFPAFAATVALLIGFVLYKPPAPPEPPASAGDNSVFAEVYSLEQSPEPLAAQSIQALFEEN